MPKHFTFPTLFDQVQTVSVSFLNKYGYLNPNQWQSGTISWFTNGENTGSISIKVNMQSINNYLELDYKCNDTPINYRVQMVSMPSNLGKGVVWFFICPRTGKRCRKLYLVEGYFYHRSAFTGCMYEKQTQSKNYRAIDKKFGKYFQFDELYEQLNRKHFKKYYAGKPTKRFLKINRQMQRAESITHHDIEQALMS